MICNNCGYRDGEKEGTKEEEAYPPKIWKIGVACIIMGFSFAAGSDLLYLCGVMSYELLIKTCIISVGLLWTLGLTIIFADITTQGEQK